MRKIYNKYENIMPNNVAKLLKGKTVVKSYVYVIYPTF